MWEGDYIAGSRLVVYFENGYRRILSRANLMDLIEQLGHDPDGWVGAHLRLFVEEGGMVLVEVIEPPV